MDSQRPVFRPDIEGFRGVAILLVVLFHAGVPGLSGGFVGVDVFFVLSGFFITGLLVRELSRSGGVDLAAFYGKRARRLLPALLLVLLTTIAAVMWLARLVAIAFAVLRYDRATPYPGVAAVLPAMAAAALIVGGSRAPTSVVSRALSAPWLRWLGRMSYAWYLWHWLLVGVGAVLDWEIGVWGRLAWSAGALVLAWLTYRFIEQPARNDEGRLSRLPQHWVAPAAVGASIVAAVIAHGAMVAAQRQAARPDQRAFAMARFDRMQHDCWATTVEEIEGPCEFGDTRSSTSLALLGDSHAEHWLGALDRIGRERGWKIVAMVKGGCPVADMPELMNARLKRWYHECTRYREAMLRRIVAMRPAGVILSSWDHYMPPDGKGGGSDWQVTPDVWRRGLRRTYARLSAAGIKTVAIRGTPRTWFDVPGCL